jgi:hypothetical protein
MKLFLTFAAKVSIAIGVILGAFYGYIVFRKWQSYDFSWDFINNNINKQLSENIGDLLWGTIGIIFTFTTTLFLFITFKEQREQLHVTKEQSDKVRFETTYFNILGMLKQVQDTVNTNISSNYDHTSARNIIEYYNNFRDLYTANLKSNKNLADFTSSFNPIEANNASIEQLQGLLATEYENYVKSINCNVGYMFRYIFNTLKFVIDDEYNKKDIKARDRYLNLLQAQLSNEELCLIFYDAISEYGKNKEGEYYFREILDTTHFLENIDSSFLLDRKHYKLYPHTIFKFLNRDEIKKVLPLQ